MGAGADDGGCEGEMTSAEPGKVMKYWDINYRWPDASLDSLKAGVNDIKEQLKQAAEKREFKPFFDVIPSEPAFLFLNDYPEVAREYFEALLYNRDTGKVHPYQHFGWPKFRTLNELVKKSIDPSTGYFFDAIGGVVITGERIKKRAEEIGISEDKFREEMGLNGYRGAVVTGLNSRPFTLLHEHFHVRDFSVMDKPPYNGHTPKNTSYELLTDIRAFLAAPGLGLGNLPTYLRNGKREIVDKLSPYRPEDGMAAALRALQYYAGGADQDLEEIILDSVHRPFKADYHYWRESKSNGKYDAMAAFHEALSLVIELESANEPIAGEISPETLAFWR